MLSFFRDLFPKEEDLNKVEKFGDDKKIQIATCTLFVEIANADSNFTKDEHELISRLLKKMYDLNDEEMHELMELAEDKIAKSISLYEFTQIINNNFSTDEKYQLVKNIWQIVYADKVLDKYEEHLVRLISNNLNLSHKDMIAAKLEVKRNLENSSD